jgi:GrpB-like predicted nucleotidyltransferase (UPF0157 family)
MHANRDSIELNFYDHNWPKLASQEIAELKMHLDHFPWLVDLHHIGSTAIPGCEAKPVLDIMLGVSDLTQARDLVPILEKLGYLFWAENPKQDRLFFVKGMPPYGERRTHHVHVFMVDSYEHLTRRIFRDFLAMHSLLRDQYVALKRETALRFKDDREAYTQAKSDFVKKIAVNAAASHLEFVPLASEHFSLVCRWFNEPHVQEFYSLRSWTHE